MRPQPRRILLAPLAAVAVLAVVSAPAESAPAPGAPRVSLLTTEGDIGVDCGSLPAGATQFRVSIQRNLLSTATVTLEPGRTSTTQTVPTNTTYTLWCSSLSGRTWTAGARTSVRYPDLELPVVRIDTESGMPIVSRDDYTAVSVAVDANGAAGISSFSATGRIKGRGNSTWDAPTDKKPYKLKFDQKQSLLGMTENKDWGLLANFFDRTMLRTAIAHYWGSKSSLAWTPNVRFAELILNGDYRGVYQVAELVEAASSRVDIDPDAGDSLVELDMKAETPWGKADDVTHFVVGRSGAKFTIKEPEEPTAAQISALDARFEEVERRIIDAGRTNSSLAALNEVLDVRSLVDWYVVSELARNFDSWFSSTYFVQKAGGRLTVGPLWDFDLSMGTYNFLPQPNADPWVAMRSPWIQGLSGNSEFRQAVRDRYRALKPTIAETDAYARSLDREIAVARENDRIRWNLIGGLDLEVAGLRGWLSGRRAWFELHHGAS